MIFRILPRMMSVTRCYSNNIRNWIIQLFQQELVLLKKLFLYCNKLIILRPKLSFIWSVSTHNEQDISYRQELVLSEYLNNVKYNVYFASRFEINIYLN